MFDFRESFPNDAPKFNELRLAKDGSPHRVARYPHGNTGLPSRGVSITLTGGLSYPHEGFGLPSRGVWVALTDKTTNMQQRTGAEGGSW